LFNKVNWLLEANIGAKISIVRDSCSYTIGTKATGRTTTCKYTTRAWSDPERLPEGEKEGNVRG